MASLVREAWRAASQLGEEVAPETRETAFKLILEALLQNGGPQLSSHEAERAPELASDVKQSLDEDIYSTPELRMDAISSYLEIPGDQVEILFGLAESTPEVQVRPSLLSSAKGRATREIALLLLGARTALGQDTQMDDIRSVVEGYRKYDKANFAKTLQTSPDLVVLGKPRSSQRTVRLRASGVHSARELAQRLVA
jgi:hypothetical protein